MASRLQIEYAIARGRTLDWMVENLGATAKQIDDTVRYLDRLNAEKDCQIRPRSRVPRKPHGTSAAYRRHMRRGETPCDECRVGNALARAKYRKKAA